MTCCGRDAAREIEAAVIDALSVYRLTRLLTLDSFPPVRRVRERLLHRWGESEWSELAVCPWCMSAYVAVAVVAARAVAPRAWTPVARVLAASAVTGLLSRGE